MQLFEFVIFGFVVGLVIFLCIRLNNWIQSLKQPVVAAPMPAQPEIPVVKQPSVAPKPTLCGTAILTQFLEQTGCPVHKSEVRGEWTYRVFQCQGAYFESYTHDKNEEVLIYYHWSVPYSPENTAWVYRFCNHFTGSNKYVRVTYNYDGDNDVFDVVLQVGAINPTIEILKYHVATILEVAQDLYIEFKKHDTRTEDELIELSRSRALFLRCQQYNEPFRVFANYKHFNGNQLTIQHILTFLFDAEQVEDLLSMTVVSEQGTEQLTQRNKIACFDLFGAIINKVNDQLQVSYSPVSITLDTTFFHYTFTLHLVEQTPENIFIRLTAMKVPYDHLQTTMPDVVAQPESISCLLCYETSTKHSFETFGKQMEEARQAAREGKELTDEQFSLLQLTEGNLEYQLREGYRLARHGHYLQAIALLEPAYRRLSKKDNELIQARYHKTIEAAYQLGVCYYQLQQFNKAYYYIHIAYKADRFDASYLYFQLLYHTQDIHLMNELTEERNKMEKILHDMAKRAEILTEEEQRQSTSVHDYYLFLYRLLAECMIREQRYDAAYNALQYLLQYEQTKEYAEAKIEELDKINPELNNV